MDHICVPSERPVQPLSSSSPATPANQSRTAIARTPSPITAAMRPATGISLHGTESNLLQIDEPLWPRRDLGTDRVTADPALPSLTPQPSPASIAATTISSPSQTISGDVAIPMPGGQSANPAQRPPEAACCDKAAALSHALRAGFAQFIATGLSFGTKPFVEAAAVTALTPVVGAAAAPFLAGLVGGIYVGSVHQLCSNFTAGMMNSCLALNSYKPLGNTEGERQWREFAAISLPVLASFTASYAVRGAMTEGVKDVWAIANSKFLASAGAAAIQGVTTDLIRQSWTGAFEASPPNPDASAQLTNQLQLLVKNKPDQQELGVSNRKLGHDYLGKIGGAIAGNVLGSVLGPLDLPGAVTPPGEGAMQGALGMTGFLTMWFTGIHCAAALGNYADEHKTAEQAGPAAAPPPQRFSESFDVGLRQAVYATRATIKAFGGAPEVDAALVLTSLYWMAATTESDDPDYNDLVRCINSAQSNDPAMNAEFETLRSLLRDDPSGFRDAFTTKLDDFIANHFHWSGYVDIATVRQAIIGALSRIDEDRLHRASPRSYSAPLTTSTTGSNRSTGRSPFGQPLSRIEDIGETSGFEGTEGMDEADRNVSRDDETIGEKERDRREQARKMTDAPSAQANLETDEDEASHSNIDGRETDSEDD